MVTELVVERVELLLANSMAVSSKLVYIRAWKLFAEAMALIAPGVNIRSLLPLSHNTVLFYIGFLSLKKLSASTITTYTSAIGYVHKIANFPNPTSNFLVQKVLASVNKINPSMDPRLPITLIILDQLVHAVPQALNNYYHIILLRAMFLVAFYGLMRVGEIAYCTKTKNPPISLDQITMFRDHFIIKIKHFKYNLTRQPIEILIKRQADPFTCPLVNLQLYLQLRGSAPGPLFIYQDGPVVLKTFFASKLKKCLNFLGLDTSLYKSHSFRIGAASMLARLNYTDSQIRLLGRWKGDAFKRYIRCERLHSCLS